MGNFIQNLLAALGVTPTAQNLKPYLTPGYNGQPNPAGQAIQNAGLQGMANQQMSGIPQPQQQPTPDIQELIARQGQLNQDLRLGQTQNQQGIWSRLGTLLQNPQFQNAIAQIAMSQGKYGGARLKGYNQAQQQQLANQLAQQNQALNERQVASQEAYRNAQIQAMGQKPAGQEVTISDVLDFAIKSGGNATDAAKAMGVSEKFTPDQLQTVDKALESSRKSAEKPVAPEFYVNTMTGRTVTAADYERFTGQLKSIYEGPFSQEQARLKAKDITAQPTLLPGRDKPYSPEVEAQMIRLKQAGTQPIDTGAMQGDIDPDSQSLLAQTGLSYIGFLALTGQAARLPRDKATRNQAFKEAQTWANKNGIDVSTMGSQYQAYNDVLQSNITRLNNTKIMEDEIQGTIQNLQGVVNDKDLGRLRAENVLKVWAGQEVNDPLAQQYAMHLYQLRNELAAYGAATQGRSGNEITRQDQEEAETAIKNGIARGSLSGLATAVENSTEKMGQVMERSVDRSRRAVWTLFGVGSKYKPTAGNTPPTSIKPTTVKLQAPDADGTTREVPVSEAQHYIELGAKEVK